MLKEVGLEEDKHPFKTEERNSNNLYDDTPIAKNANNLEM